MRLRISLLILGVIIAGLMLLTAPVAAQGGEGDPERGAQLFADNCAVCHGEKGQGRVGATLTDVFVSMNADVELTQIIADGREGTAMPAWGEAKGGPLSETDVQDLVAYIESWGTTYEPPAPAPPRPQQQIPPVPEVSGDPNSGYTVYFQNCAACHGEKGEGRIGTTLNTAFPAIKEGGALALQTVRDGRSGTLMPAWSQAKGGPLTDQEINDAVAYVLSIQRSAPQPGGDVPVPTGSALPLVLVAVGALALILALGVAVNRRQKSG
jgi:mono/diheme cytochrome c family protein